MKTILLIYLIFIIGTFLATIKDFDNIAITPNQIYESNNINMFGCVLLFMIAFILDPLFFIAYFLYWVFHVGRED